MYETGEVRVALRALTEDEEEALLDDGDPEDRPPRDVTFPVVWLPHSCDEWAIGGPAEVRALIADLEAALARMEGR